MKTRSSASLYALLLCFFSVGVLGACTAPQQFSSNMPDQTQTFLPSSQTQMVTSTIQAIHETQQQDQSLKVTILSPDLSKPLKSPLVLHGKVSGTFFFEGTFPVTLVDSSGKTIAHASAQADGEWATDAQVSFTVKVPFKVKSQTEAMLIFNNDNPSGLAQNDSTDTFNVTLEK